MEPVSLAVGVAGLAMTFNTCMDCFECIQLARSFGEDFGKCILRLDTARLRMSRWGASAGLGRGPRARTPLSISMTEVLVAQGLLEDIQSSFEHAKNISEGYKKRVILQQPQTTDLEVYNPSVDLSAGYRNLHLTMREIALQRQEQTSWLQKTKWALYEKRRFDDVVKDVTRSVNELVDLFPFTKDTQLSYCKEEVLAIKDRKGLELMDVICEGSDNMLRDALRHELGLRGNLATNWQASGNSKFRLGDDNAYGVISRGNTSTDFSVSGSAEVRIGNSNWGK